VNNTDVDKLRDDIIQYRSSNVDSNYLNDDFLSHLHALMIKPVPTIYPPSAFKIDTFPDTMTKEYLSRIYYNMNDVKSLSYKSDKVIFDMIVLRDLPGRSDREDSNSTYFSEQSLQSS
jgi:hypothetical protein